MSAKKPVTRNKEAKINAIVDATLEQVTAIGYEKVTIRDIAEAANVSVGLIYKYFPGGKFDIIINGFGSQNLGKFFAPKQPETIEYGDFPGYMRAVIVSYRQVARDNDAFLKALVDAGLHGGAIFKDINKVELKNFGTVSEFFSRFKGVDLDGKDPVELGLNWDITVKSIIVYNLIYPAPYLDEEALTDLLVDLSLRIWGYPAGKNSNQ